MKITVRLPIGNTGQAAIENVKTIDERRSKSLETELLVAICRPTEDMTIKNTVSRDF